MTPFTLLSPFATQPAPSEIHFRGGEFLESLVLFDRIILPTAAYSEFMYLAQRFGMKAVDRLIRQGIVVPYLGNGMSVQVGQIPPLRLRNNRNVLPKLHFEIQQMWYRNVDKVTDDWIRRDSNLDMKTKRRLGKLLNSSLELCDERIIRPSNEVWKNLLEADSSLFADAISIELMRRKLPAFRPEAIRCEVVYYDGPDMRVQTNLPKLIHGLSVDVEHSIVEMALLTSRHLVETYTAARFFEGIPSMPDSLKHFSSTSCPFAADSRDVVELTGRLGTVLEINDFPSMQALFDHPDLALEDFLGIRESKECAEFRAWLRAIDFVDPIRVAEASNSVRQKLFEFSRSTTGKAIRLAMTPIRVGFESFSTAGEAFGSIVDVGLKVKESVFTKSSGVSQSGALAFLNIHLAKLWKRVEQGTDEV